MYIGLSSVFYKHRMTSISVLRGEASIEFNAGSSLLVAVAQK